MTRSLIGIDIGKQCIKLAVVRENRILKTATLELSEPMVVDGKISSPLKSVEIIKEVIKKNKIRAKDVALVEYGEGVFVKRLTMPIMSAEQLKYNLPFEFRDYTNDKLDEYVYDYSMISKKEELQKMLEENLDDNGDKEFEQQEKKAKMELLGVALRKKRLEQFEEIFKKAGLRLVKVAPDVCTKSPLIRYMDPIGVKNGKEFCFIDLGYESIGMDMYLGDQYVVTRVVEHGIYEAEKIVADVFSVDNEQAHMYFSTNYENCQYHERCLALYDAIAIELMRAVNFYMYNNADSNLEDVWICGGGVSIEPLMESIKEHLSLNIHGADELIPDKQKIDNASLFIHAIGVTRD